MLQKKEDLLKQLYGYDDFRPGQLDVINAILDGKDTFAVMPTGAGKSVCYQIPALMMEGITLVISPLISLMKDQVKNLNEMGIHAAYLNSSLTYNQYKLALANAYRGQYKIIYVAPERLDTEEFLEFALSSKISMISVDEAHCVSQWGQDFRPSYLKIGDFIKKLKLRPVVSAFTATATEKVSEDVINLLELQNQKLVVTGFDRQNLYFGVNIPKDKNQTVCQYISMHSKESGIIYCSTRKGVEDVHEMLLKKGYQVTRYHAGLSDEERRENQDDFIFDRKPIMVATNAFGMGIDKSNVRYVIHYNMPKNMESYYQEAGRAGRDGEPAECILLFSKKDIQTNQFFIENSNENEEMSEMELEIIRANEREKLRKMTWYCYTQGCLREYILHYFGEEMTGGCKNCSNCLTDTQIEDVTEESKYFINAVQETGQRFGESMIVEMLHGSSTAKIRQFGLDRCHSFGLLKNKSLDRIRQISKQLQLEEYIIVTSDVFPILKVGELAQELMNGNDKIELRVELKKKKGKNNQKSSLGGKDKTGTNQGNFIKSEGRKEDNLFESLRRVRMDIARQQKVPPYIIFSDRTLVEMCQHMPETEEEMLTINGVGRVKYEKYGELFLSTILESKINNP